MACGLQRAFVHNFAVCAQLRHSERVVVQTSCGLPLQISLPQDTRHLAWALYNEETTCAEVREPTIQPASYSQGIHLDFVDVDSPSAWELTYHSCTDTTWEFTAIIVYGTVTVGPIAPSVFVYNPCDTDQEFSFNLAIQQGGKISCSPLSHLFVHIALQHDLLVGTSL